MTIAHADALLLETYHSIDGQAGKYIHREISRLYRSLPSSCGLQTFCYMLLTLQDPKLPEAAQLVLDDLCAEIRSFAQFEEQGLEDTFMEGVDWGSN